jgi:hypothetical protein
MSGGACWDHAAGSDPRIINPKQTTLKMYFFIADSFHWRYQS